MAVIWNVNPITINIVTDVFLIVMLFVWLNLMKAASALGIKKNLRLGSRQYSYERMGKLPYLRSGWRKYGMLRKNGLLLDGEMRQWRIRTLVAFSTFIFTVALVLVHVLIDFGLKFAFQPQESGRTAKYQMIELQANPDFVGNMRAFENIRTALGTCMQLEESSLDCIERADALQELLSTNLDESMSFARTLYGSASVAERDVFDEIEFEYLSVDAENITTIRNDCFIQEQKNLIDYDGTLLYRDDTSPCLPRGIWSRVIELDMRARKVATTKPIGGTAGDDLSLGDISVSSDVDFVSYEKFKDERQIPSQMETEHIESIGELRETNKVFRLRVDSHVAYGKTGSQKLRIMDLTRRKFGSFNDPAFSIATMGPLIEPAPDDIATCLSPATEYEGRKSWNLSFQLEGPNVTCSYQMKAVMDTCESYETTYADNGEGGETRTQTIGYQKLEGLVLISDGDVCGEQARKQYTRQLSPTLDSDRLGLVLSLQFEIACTRVAEDSSRLSCIYGPDSIYYDGSSFQVERPRRADGFLFRRISLKSIAAWTAYEVEGGDLAAIREVKENVAAIFKEHYPTLRILSNKGVMRGLVLRTKMHFSMRDIVAALSSQIAEVDRDVVLFDDAKVTKLGVPYFVGVAIVIALNFLAGVFVVIRLLQENRRYKSLSMAVKIPTTTTSWIEAALISNSNQKESAFNYECRKWSSNAVFGEDTERARPVTDVHFTE